MKDRDGARLILWLWLTQRNGRGPRRYLGLVLLEWLLLALLAVMALLGCWLLFRIIL